MAHDLLFFFKGVNAVTVAIDVARLLLHPKISEFLGLMERAKLLKNYIYKGAILHVERKKVEKITNYVVSCQKVEIPVFTENEISFRNFGKFWWISVDFGRNLLNFKF